MHGITALSGDTNRHSAIVLQDRDCRSPSAASRLARQCLERWTQPVGMSSDLEYLVHLVPSACGSLPFPLCAALRCRGQGAQSELEHVRGLDGVSPEKNTEVW